MNIKQLSKSNGLSMGDLAILLHIHPSTLSNWANQVSYPTLDYVIEMAKIFKVKEQVIVNCLKNKNYKNRK